MLVWGRRDGGEPACGRPWNGEIGARGLRWLPSHLRVTGKMRGRELGSDTDKAEGQRWQQRAIAETALSLSCIRRDTAPAPRVRGSVDRPTMFDARDPYVLPHT